MQSNPDFRSVVFAGGGSRCFWQLGFWSTAAPALSIMPDTVSGVSAGAAFAGVAAYNIEKHLTYPLHPVFSVKLGYRGEVISVKDCSTREDLADLILQSSCAPPLLPVMRRNGRVVLDGGMIDNVPVSVLDDCTGRKLVLLTRQYKNGLIPESRDTVYVQPSEKIRITKWEYTDPEGLQYVYDMGRRDGESFIKRSSKNRTFL